MAAGKVKTLSITSIVLGAIGLLGVLSGAVSFFVGPRAPTGPVAGMTAQQVEINQAMAKAFLDLTNAWKTYNGVELILSFVIAVALIAGGIMSLKLRKQGRDVLAITFAVAIPSKVVHMVISVLIGMGTMQIMHEFVPKIMHATTSAVSPVPKGVEGVTTSVVEVSALFGIVLGIGWILLQIGFYIVGAMYLRKPEVRARFSS